MNDKELDFYIKNFKRTGDSQYYEKIYKFFFQKIYRFVQLNASDRYTAEEITVDVFYKVYRYITRVRLNSASFKPWIYKIARNLVIDYYRKGNRHEKSLSLERCLEEKQSTNLGDAAKIKDSLIPNITIENSSTEIILAEFNNQDLLKGLNALPDLQKQVVILRFIEELDYKSIGIIINKSEPTVRAIKFRAILKLKEILSK